MVESINIQCTCICKTRGPKALAVTNYSLIVGLVKESYVCIISFIWSLCPSPRLLIASIYKTGVSEEMRVPQSIDMHVPIFSCME